MYLDDPGNLAIVRLSAMVQKDPDLGKIIDALVGSVFRRTESGYALDE